MNNYNISKYYWFCQEGLRIKFSTEYFYYKEKIQISKVSSDGTRKEQTKPKKMEEKEIKTEISETENQKYNEVTKPRALCLWADQQKDSKTNKWENKEKWSYTRP